MKSIVNISAEMWLGRKRHLINPRLLDCRLLFPGGQRASVRLSRLPPTSHLFSHSLAPVAERCYGVNAYVHRKRSLAVCSMLTGSSMALPHGAGCWAATQGEASRDALVGCSLCLALMAVGSQK